MRNYSHVNNFVFLRNYLTYYLREISIIFFCVNFLQFLENYSRETIIIFFHVNDLLVIEKLFMRIHIIFFCVNNLLYFGKIFTRIYIIVTSREWYFQKSPIINAFILFNVFAWTICHFFPKYSCKCLANFPFAWIIWGFRQIIHAFNGLFLLNKNITWMLTVTSTRK